MRVLWILAGLASAAHADPRWRLDLAVRGVGSIATGDSGSLRSGLAPALAIRAEWMVGAFAIGGSIAVAAPAWAGQLDAAIAADDAVAHGAQWAAAVGVDGGASVFYFDAGLGDSHPMDPVKYWGPFARVRAQLHYLWPQPNGRELGLVLGPLVAATWAHPWFGERTDGARLEPGFELGLTLRL
ncbi:MAG: hypothetical protein ABI678_07875 [Kofleriaceae bacterium]